MSCLIETENLRKLFALGGRFSLRRHYAHAVDGVDLQIWERETLGLVGESGCGKTTLGRLILRLIEPTEGKIYFKGEDFLDVDAKALRRLRSEIQIIFQDPSASLNPMKSIRHILAQPYLIHNVCGRDEVVNRIVGLLETVNLSPPEAFLDRYPRELSGGQKQRIGIARAIALNPTLVVADEPVSSLDVSIRGKILNLMEKLQKDLRMTYLFISHDLTVVRAVSRRIAVMYLGKIVELAEKNELFENPIHPYTQALLSATPFLDPRSGRKHRRITLKGDVPSPIDVPPGCRFHTRCPLYKESDRPSICATKMPDLEDIGDKHFVGCHLKS